MISADEARSRELGPFRGAVFALPACLLAWLALVVVLVLTFG